MILDIISPLTLLTLYYHYDREDWTLDNITPLFYRIDLEMVEYFNPHCEFTKH